MLVFTGQNRSLVEAGVFVCLDAGSVVLFNSKHFRLEFSVK